LILFALGLPIVNATENEFKEAWTQSFQKSKLSHEEVQRLQKTYADQCRKVWLNAREVEKEARQAGIFIGDDYVKDKLKKEWRKHYYREEYGQQIQNWFLPFLRHFSNIDASLSRKEKRTPIRKRLTSPEGYTSKNNNNTYTIGGDSKERAWTLELIAELNAAFNCPLVSLAKGTDTTKLYATVVFKMQPCIPLVSSWVGRHANDHAALVLEYYDNDKKKWKSVMVDYYNMKRGCCGWGGKYGVSVKDKRSAYKAVLWNPAADENFHTFVNYFRYATFTFSREERHNKALSVMERGVPYLKPNSMLDLEGYENCCTYEARLLAFFSSGAAENGAPEGLLATYYNKFFSPWFTAGSLRDIIAGAQGRGTNEVTLNHEVLRQQLVESYMTSDKEPRTMYSYPIKLYDEYADNKDNLVNIWEGREPS